MLFRFLCSAGRPVSVRYAGVGHPDLAEEPGGLADRGDPLPLRP